MARHLSTAMLVALLLVTWGGVLLTASASGHEFEVRIVARRVVSGSTEFALQQRDVGGAWGERQYPSRRYFPASAAEGRWLVSTSLDLATLRLGASVETRITARKNVDGFIEFALQRRGVDGEWGDREFPTRRFFPPTAAVGGWLVSTPLRVRAPEPPPVPTPWATAIADPPP